MKKCALIALLLCYNISFIWAQNFSRLAGSSETTIDNIVATYMGTGKNVGVAIGVIKNGEIVYLKGYGDVDKERGTKVDAQTIFRLASVSKTIVSVAALQLVQSGDLNLSMDIRNANLLGTAWPSKTFGGNSVTITPENLLTNESGLPHYGWYNSLYQGGYDHSVKNTYIFNHLFSINPVKSFEIFKNMPVVYTPGTKYSYSSQSFDLLDAVVEKAGNSPIEQQVWDRIAKVANMPFLNPGVAGKMPYYNYPAYYDISNGNVVRVENTDGDGTDVSHKLGGGGWMCSAEDFANFMVTLMNSNSLLNSTYYNLMTSDHLTTDNNYYGYGCIPEPSGTDTEIKHTGGQTGVSTIYRYLKNAKNGVVVLSNTSLYNNSTNWISHYIMSAIGGLSVSGTTYSSPIPSTYSIGTPTLSLPANNATSVDNNVVLSWQAVDNCETYVVQYALNSSFTGGSSFLTTDTVKGTTLNITGIGSGIKHYWRVKAFNDFMYGGKSGSWSSVYNFTTTSSADADLLPFEEGFDDKHGVQYLPKERIFSGKGYKWSFEDPNQHGRLRYGTYALESVSGNGAITLDNIAYSSNGSNATKYLILTIDLADYSASTDLTLSFDYIHHGDESHTNDKVWIRSSNSSNWRVAYDWYQNRAALGTTKNVSSLDIDAILGAFNEAVSSTFQVRFGQEDNSTARTDYTGDGLTIDNIKIDGHKTITWTGAAGSSTWADAGNWSSSHIPDHRHNVVIPNVTNKPSITNTTHSVRDLTVESGATMYVYGTGVIIVQGAVTNNGWMQVLNGGKLKLNGPSGQTLNLGLNIDKLEVDNSNGITLGQNTEINDLTLTNGHLDVGSYDLTLKGTTTHGNSNSYIRVSGSGRVKVEVGSDPVILPIGRNPYLPIIIDDGGGAEFTVGVTNNIYGNPESSSNEQTANAVSETWTITADANVSSATVQIGWDAAEEMTGFDRTNSNISYWQTGTSTRWNTSANSGATGSGPYYQSRTMNFSQNVVYYFGIGSSGGALPVELTYFEANWSASKSSGQTEENESLTEWSPSQLAALLTWETSMEENNSHFCVERSYNGDEWKTIGRVEGNGTSDFVHGYQFTDNSLPLTVNSDLSTIYYRLKQVDFNGDFEYSTVRTLSLAERSRSQESRTCSVYPNPIKNGQLNISEFGTYGVLDISGKEVIAPANTQSINVDILPAGMYFVKSQDGKLVKFMKQ